MDKKNLIIGLLLLGIAGFLMLRSCHAPQQPPQSTQTPAAATPAAATQQTPVGTSSSNDAFMSIMDEPKDSGQECHIHNNYIQVNFDEAKGTVRNITLGKYDATLNGGGKFIFNEKHAEQIFTIQGNKEDMVKFDDVSVTYTPRKISDTEIEFTATYQDTLKVTRHYKIAMGDGADDKNLKDTKDAQDPYLIQCAITFENLKDAPLPQQNISLNIGTAAPIHEHDSGMYMSIGCNNGKDTSFIASGDFSKGGFLGMSEHVTYKSIPKAGSVTWASVSNQFFTGIFMSASQEKGTQAADQGLVARRIDPKQILGKADANNTPGLTASVGMSIPALDSKNPKATRAFNYFAGPKEYTRIRHFPHSEDDVMQFGAGWYKTIMLSGFFAPLMNTLMNFMHGLVGQWGIAIILMTLFLKVITLPFTLASARTSRRMQKIQPELAALKEKFKDNPQKQQKATMELFKQHKVNPMGGCLPILITMPLFVAFFVMLQSTAELRFQSFLWAKDLAAPDTVWHIPGIGIPLNIMPLLMGATMFFQMRLTPSPSVDNAQTKMMKFMPIIFLFICYSFSCALALYSTINGLFTICQQLIVNHMKEKADTTAPAGAANANSRPIKNVTPVKPLKKK